MLAGIAHLQNLKSWMASSSPLTASATWCLPRTTAPVGPLSDLFVHPMWRSWQVKRITCFNREGSSELTCGQYKKLLRVHTVSQNGIPEACGQVMKKKKPPQHCNPFLCCFLELHRCLAGLRQAARILVRMGTFSYLSFFLPFYAAYS